MHIINYKVSGVNTSDQNVKKNNTLYPNRSRNNVLSYEGGSPKISRKIFCYVSIIHTADLSWKPHKNFPKKMGNRECGDEKTVLFQKHYGNDIKIVTHS